MMKETPVPVKLNTSNAINKLDSAAQEIIYDEVDRVSKLVLEKLDKDIDQKDAMGVILAGVDITVDTPLLINKYKTGGYKVLHILHDRIINQLRAGVIENFITIDLDYYMKENTGFVNVKIFL